MKTTPCKTCPWRISSDPTGADIPNFDFDKMLGLERTVPPEDQPDLDGFYEIMACHLTDEGEDEACRGYVARHGVNNINVRLLASFGKCSIRDSIRDCEGIPLYGTYYDMRNAMADALAPAHRREVPPDGNPVHR